MGKLRFLCSPYGFIESLNWLIKHLIIDIFYPVVFLFLLFVIFTIIPLEVLLTLGIFLALSVVAFVIRGIRRIRNRIKNIGDLNEDGWREFTINHLQEPIYEIGFVGDIMKMGKYQLKFEKRVIKFFASVDLMVGNLEGIITNVKWQGLAAQRHKNTILNELKKLGHSPEDWLLCTSNNHSSDFGDDEFLKSNILIREADYNVFGEGKHKVGEEVKDFQSFPFREEINIVSGTMWNNQRDNDLVSKFENVDEYYKQNKINILYPHWHYENESYVRKRNQLKSIALILMGYYLVLERIKKGVYQAITSINATVADNLVYRKFRRYLKIVDPLVNRKYYRKFNKKFKDKEIRDWDLIFGHHSHVPQPITKYSSRVLAFSGGNFTSSKTRKKHISGLIMRCQIGMIKNSKHFGIGKVDWSYIINEKEKIKKKKAKNIHVDSVVIDCKRNRRNSFTNLRNKIWVNIIYVTFFSLFEFILFCSIFDIFYIFSNYLIFIFLTAIIFVIVICYYLFRAQRN